MIEKDRNSETSTLNSKGLEFVIKWFKISSFFSQIILIIAVGFITIVEIAPLILYAKYFLYPDIIIQIVVWSALIFSVVFWTQFNFQNWIGQLFTGVSHVAAFLIINELILKRTEDLNAFPVITMFGWGLVGLMAFVLLFNLINFLFLMPIIRIKQNSSIKEWFEKIKTTIYSSKKILAIGIIISLMLGIGAIIVLKDTTWNVSVEIQPKNYQAQIAFWGSHFPEKYNDSVKFELNEHNVLISCYDFYYNLSDPNQKQQFINIMTYWNNSYPNIKFLVSIIAPIGGFIWNGESEEIINKSKQYLEIIHEENLTNIVGLSFDWEKPNNKDKLIELGYELAPAKNQHERSIQLWNEFFDWVELNYPNTIMQNVHDVESSIDTYDSDNAFQILKRHNIFDVPRWSEYAPMIYRGECKGTRPYGDYPYYKPKDAPMSHYIFYMYLKLHAEAVYKYHKSYDRLGVYIGITNLTAYGRDVIQFEHGEEIGKGFDALVRDALIAKSFGAPRITIFILDTVGSSLDPMKNYSMGGVFDVWGISFLDEFNQSINGENSTKPFKIWYSQKLSSLFSIENLEFFIFDFVYQSNELTLLPIILIEPIIIIILEKKIYSRKPK